MASNGGGGVSHYRFDEDGNPLGTTDGLGEWAAYSDIPDGAKHVLWDPVDTRFKTIDQVLYLAGAGADLTTYATLEDALGVFIVTNPAYAGGATGDGSTDDTSAFVAARDAAIAAGGGTLYLPPGTYKLNEFDLTTSACQAIAMTGVYGSTFIVAAVDSTFAVHLDITHPEDAENQMFRGVHISNLAFTGRPPGGNYRMRCGLFAPVAVRLENVSFHECLIGLAIGGGTSFYHGGRNVSFEKCFVGCLQGSYLTANNSIGDLVNGTPATVSVTLPQTPAATAPNGGNLHWDTCKIWNNRIGFAIVSPDGTAYHNRFTKCSIESNQESTVGVGLLVISGSATLDDCYFESNGSTSTTTLDGVSYESGAVVVGYDAASSSASTRGQGGQVRLIGGTATDRLYARAGGSIWIDHVSSAGAVSLANSVITSGEGGGNILADHLQLDNVGVPFKAARLYSAGEAGRAAVAIGEFKTQQVWGVQPYGGVIKISDDCTGPTSFSSSLITVGVGTPTFGNSGGVQPDQRYLSIASSTDVVGLTLNASAVTWLANEDWYWVLHFNMRTSRVFDPVTNPYRSVNGTPALVAAPTTALVPPLNAWFPFALVTRPTNTVHNGVAFQWRWEFDAAATVDLSGIQVARFNDRAAAAEFMADNRFYMTEA